MIFTHAHHPPHFFAHSPFTYSLRNSTTLIPIPKLNTFPISKFGASLTRPGNPLITRAHEPEVGAVQNPVAVDFNLDSVLSLLELACLLSSLVASVCFAAVTNNGGLVAVGSNCVVVACGVLAMVVVVCGVAIGAWIRRRQWRRICGVGKGGLEVNLVERVQRLEEELRSSVTVIRVLSKQVEKLGVRFRVTRQNLKDPIAEGAALAQKNSEDTRELAVQSEILEKELREIQKVLLAMQEQQQKQLDLILAIGKTSKLWESKPKASAGEEQDTSETPNSAEDEVKPNEVHQI